VSGTVVYLITSHRLPQQVLRLAKTLRSGSPHAPIVVHHDRSSTTLDPRPFRELESVHLLQFSVPVEWGGMSIVEMNLRCFRWILDHLDFEWLVLVSGQDYPLKPLDEIEESLRTATHDGLMEEPAEVRNRVLRPDPRRIHYSFTFRYFYRYYTLPSWPGRVEVAARLRRRASSALWRVLPRVQGLVFLHPMPTGARPRLGVRRLRSPFTHGFGCYKASPWFTLRRRAIERITEMGPRERALWRYYSRTVIPDESYFQTILFNDRTFRFHPDNMVFSKWHPGSGSPEVLTREDLPEALSSGKHFARKLDMEVDPSALDELDRHLFPPRKGRRP
jgi:hypothetical protein